MTPLLPRATSLLQRHSDAKLDRRLPTPCGPGHVAILTPLCAPHELHQRRQKILFPHRYWENQFRPRTSGF